MTATPSRMRELFAANDQRDPARFSEHLCEDVDFRFGNAAPLHGRQPVHELVAGFFPVIGGIRHDLAEAWEFGDSAICRGEVTYARHDGRVLTVPFANVFKCRDGRILEYLIYVDNSALFAH
jgi:ketosteroid isomerase-like protein